MKLWTEIIEFQNNISGGKLWRRTGFFSVGNQPCPVCINVFLLSITAKQETKKVKVKVQHQTWNQSVLIAVAIPTTISSHCLGLTLSVHKRAGR